MYIKDQILLWGILYNKIFIALMDGSGVVYIYNCACIYLRFKHAVLQLSGLSVQDSELVVVLVVNN